MRDLDSQSKQSVHECALAEVSFADDEDRKGFIGSGKSFFKNLTVMAKFGVIEQWNDLPPHDCAPASRMPGAVDESRVEQQIMQLHKQGQFLSGDDGCRRIVRPS